MKITPLKMWVQNVLPVVYDDSLSYYEMVGKINEKTNEIINQVNENTDAIESLNYVIQELGDIDELKALLEEVETIVSDLYSDDTPVMDSANGSAGVADHAARSDHSHPSDTSKADVSLGIDGALAGQYVKIKTVEAGIPTEYENGAPHEIPSGGNANNILIKYSNSNFDVGWTSTPAQMGSLAYIEQTSTVSKPEGYKSGEYLVYNGQLYKVTTTISQGQTLTVGENIVTVNTGNELTDLSAIVSNKIIKYNTAISIPTAGGNSGNIACTGLTGDYELIRWNFSVSIENAPPTALSWETGTNYFKIYNIGNASPSENIRPVFALPTLKTN